MLTIPTLFTRHAAVLLGAAGLLLLTGCVGDMPHRGGWSPALQNKRVQQAYGLSNDPESLAVTTPASKRDLPAAPVELQAQPVIVQHGPTWSR